MEPLRPKGGVKPETKLQNDWIEYFRGRGWHVMVTHGNMFQSGFPDLFCTHYDYGPRWVEIKLPDRKGQMFTPAQLREFPKMCANGSGVWVLTGEWVKDARGEPRAKPTYAEYKKIFKPFNWGMYLLKYQPRG